MELEEGTGCGGGRVLIGAEGKARGVLVGKRRGRRGKTPTLSVFIMIHDATML